MEITGKLVQKLPVQSGTGANGNWSRADILIETIEQYARKVCISFWGERARMLEQFQEGSLLVSCRSGTLGVWDGSITAGAEGKGAGPQVLQGQTRR